MSDYYPLPSYGLSIWLTGDTLNVALPPSTPEGKGHTVKIPLAKLSIETNESGQPLGRQRGWLVLMELLKSKEREKRSPATIGTRRAPVRYDIEQMLKAVAPKAYDKRGQQIVNYDDLFGEET